METPLVTRLAAASAALLLLAFSTASYAADAFPPETTPEARAFLRQVERGVEPGLAAPRAPSPSADGSGACPHDFDALHYHLDLAIDPVAKQIGGSCTLTAVAEMAGLAAVTLDLTDSLTVDSVFVNDLAASFSRPTDVLEVTLPTAAALGETLEVRTHYHGDPASEGPGGFGGFWWNYQVAFSMGVGLNADPPSMGRAWFPCWDEPCDKSTVDLVITVPDDQVAAANGLLVSTEEDTLAATKTYTWVHDYPISTYLIAVAVSDYTVLTDSTYSWISYFVYPYLVDRALTSFSDVHLMMDAFTSFWGPYPYDKFSYMLASKGDMEHQTCVTHLASLVNGFHNYDYVLAHEMAHQWWGDGITVSDWRDVWLSEGFATYHEALYFGWKNGTTAYDNYMNGIMNTVLTSSETTPIYDPDPMWGTTSYEKGATVLHMLRHVVGDSLFFDALRAHWAAYAYGNHDTADLQATFQTITGTDLDWFFDEWIYQPGYPQYEWSWGYAPAPGPAEGGGWRVSVAIDQVQTLGPVFTMPVDLEITTAGGDTTITAWVDESPELVQVTVPDEPTGIVLDPGNWILKTETEVAASDVPGAGTQAGRLTWLADPVPSAGEVTFRIETPAAGPVTLDIIDGRGRLVRRLHDERAGAGALSLRWDARDASGRPVSPGVYFARLGAAGTSELRKIVLVR